MSLPRYPEYKDSGVEWLGVIPLHWTEVALTRVLAAPVTDGPHTTPIFVDEGIPFLSVDGIQNGELVFEGCRYISHEDHVEFSRKAAPRKGDILMGKAASIGKIARVKMDTVFDIWSPLALIRSDEGVCDATFLEYALKSKESQAQIETKANSNTQLNIGMKDIPKLRICLPSKTEQQAIATFLDRETGKIDALIAEQLRLVELLAEKRQAVISNAVTKGLNTNAPMKDSGIEWLGEVPEHWRVTRLAYSAAIENGTTPSRVNQDYWLGGDIPWLSSGEVNQYRITEANEFITKKALDECSLRLLPRKTIVIGMIGQGKTRGLSASLEIEASINQNLAAIVPGKNLEPDYLLYIFQSVYDYLREFGRGGNQAALNCEILSALKVPLPPLEEQFHICAYLEVRLKEFDTLTAEANRAIALLQERRSALISAAVTGKIDVRGLGAIKEAA